MEETNEFGELKKLTINTLCNITALNRLHQLKTSCGNQIVHTTGSEFEDGYNVAMKNTMDEIDSIIQELKQE